MKHLLKAKTFLAVLLQHPFDLSSVAGAQKEFSVALNDFSDIDHTQQFVPGVSAFLPVYGNKVHAALHLVPLAMELSRAGLVGCDVLRLLMMRLHSSLSAQSQNITMADFTFITQHLQDVQASINSAINEADQLAPVDLRFDPHLGALVDVLHKDLSMLHLWSDRIVRILPVVPMLLGIDTSANYLLEVLDSTELRPGGGFIGNYGIATFTGARLVATHITDTSLLDHAFSAARLTNLFPVAYSWFDIVPKYNWGLRDSNLDADFPTVARYAESLYTREGGNIPLQGVIAITPTFIQNALTITGPIYLPEYHETINAHNLVERIHYHQLGPRTEGPGTVASPDGYSSQRKHFTALLAERFFSRVCQSASSNVAKFLLLVVNGIRTKDLQIYLNNSRVEALFHQDHLDAAIQTESGDGIFVVDANIAGNKANSVIVNTLADTVTIDAAGNATHLTQLRYSWTIPEQYSRPIYRDYIRVYVPRGSMLLTQKGWKLRSNSNDFGHEVWAGFFSLRYGQTRTITLTWRVPHVATHDQYGWHYQDMIQRQAGAVWTFKVHVTLPPCTIRVNRSVGMKLLGKQAATASQSLTENTHMVIDYRC
ncbi:hypothetical protein KDW_05250 [Dictyobacter vulcani]|uniref:Uncharacterized protein n=1 Tax=Dictyobacter vulcani TaxID=2607529 RepID=A0A5J4KFG6_9CHLR|nr:DUF4012 domain-containing protein [Dictyobacter vulcani]GER86363.1 hypothetical protein KDW_05250 [Dictyobacter vulcani]